MTTLDNCAVFARRCTSRKYFKTLYFFYKRLDALYFFQKRLEKSSDSSVLFNSKAPAAHHDKDKKSKKNDGLSKCKDDQRWLYLDRK